MLHVQGLGLLVYTWGPKGFHGVPVEVLCRLSIYWSTNYMGTWTYRQGLEVAFP